jgi:hypothetical protein
LIDLLEDKARKIGTTGDALTILVEMQNVLDLALGRFLYIRGLFNLVDGVEQRSTDKVTAGLTRCVGLP